MAEILFWLTYDDLGRPREAGTYMSHFNKIPVEISESIFDMWAESSFSSLLPVSEERSEFNPKAPPRYVAEEPELIAVGGSTAAWL